VTNTMRTVAIAEMVISDDPLDVLVAYGLGSCVAVCLYDPVKHVAGMVHSLLPAAPNGNGSTSTPAKFVTDGVPLMLDELLKRGAVRARLVAHLCGGAQMLTAPGFSNKINIGDRNESAAEAALAAARIRIRARATGGSSGRTVKLFVEDGQITVRTVGDKEHVL
jgi:chemotaxis protein CheD